MNIYDLIGIGQGPFNLSLNALMKKTSLKSLFIEKNDRFCWHPEINFEDSLMQTTFYKDLVTGVDPTSPYTFLNYLVQNGLFYPFMNTGRTVVTRKEFENYFKWASDNLNENSNFGEEVKEINFKKDSFQLETNSKTYFSKHISIGTGVTPRIPDFAQGLISNNLFHAKSKSMLNLNATNKNIIIVGGGQTGIEIFRNILNGRFGQFKSIKLISNRPNLQPLDESPFTNEYFTPNYVNCFFGLEQSEKDKLVESQKLASDGNTPKYLEWLYNDLYQKKYVYQDEREIEIRPNRKVEKIIFNNNHYKIQYYNRFTKKNEETSGDVVILATGFQTKIPTAIEPIKHLIGLDQNERLIFNQDFSIKWEFQNSNKIFGMNLSRHEHGISDPQTSLMAHRSATIVNSLHEQDFYNLNNNKKNFINFCREDND